MSMSPLGGGSPDNFLRDACGMALGLTGAAVFTAPVHYHTVETFWQRIAPMMPWGDYPTWSVIWAVCVFVVIMCGIRYGFALLMGLLINGLSLLVVRLSLPRRRR